MYKRIETPERQLVGIQTRTHLSTASADIVETITRYKSLLSKNSPLQDTYCVYTDYESDYRGAYTFFIGNEKKMSMQLPPGFTTCLLPAQSCLHLETPRGPMPNIVIDTWQTIWREESQNQLPGVRRYAADFEIYKAAETDLQHMKVDIFLGIKD